MPSINIWWSSAITTLILFFISRNLKKSFETALIFNEHFGLHACRNKWMDYIGGLLQKKKRAIEYH
jgi:hypothetical protein